MVIPDFKNKSIFLDTAPLIYFIEGSSPHQLALEQLFRASDRGTLRFVTSTITLVEVLVKPVREGKPHIVQQYKDILISAPGIEMAEIDHLIAVKAAELRALYHLKTPDALQLASALTYETDYFLTNDIRLKNIVSIPVITLDELKGIRI